MAELFRAMRPHHWVKNLLVFLPIIAAHRWGEIGLWSNATLEFLAFCFCSSAVYLVNDLADLADDRAHPQKRHRPLASGRLSLRLALLAASALFVSAFIFAALAGAAFPLSAYGLAAILYSLWGKTFAILDLFWLVGLYLTRILAGASATEIHPSGWLLTLAAMIFASLVSAKRCAELTAVAGETLPLPKRRGYRVEDRGLLMAAGLASAFAAQIVLLLYLQEASSEVVYTQPGWLMLAGAAVLGWLMRIWLLVGRGQMQTDPIIHALRDPLSHLTMVVVIGCFVLAVS